MTFHESVLRRTVIGTYQTMDGNAIHGSIEFMPSYIGIDRTQEAKRVFVQEPVVAKFDMQGRFSATLLCADDPGLEPQWLSYAVKENFDGGRSYNIVLFYEDGEDIDIVDVGPHSPPVPLPPMEGITQTDADLRYVNVYGDKLTGPLELYADPTLDLEASTKHYSDFTVGRRYRQDQNVVMVPTWDAHYSPDPLIGHILIELPRVDDAKGLIGLRITGSSQAGLGFSISVTGVASDVGWTNGTASLLLSDEAADDPFNNEVVFCQQGAAGSVRHAIALGDGAGDLLGLGLNLCLELFGGNDAMAGQLPAISRVNGPVMPEWTWQLPVVIQRYATRQYADDAAATMMGDHLADPDPHPQYIQQTHLADADPHPQYLNQARGDALYVGTEAIEVSVGTAVPQDQSKLWVDTNVTTP